MHFKNSFTSTHAKKFVTDVRKLACWCTQNNSLQNWRIARSKRRLWQKHVTITDLIINWTSEVTGAYSQSFCEFCSVDCMKNFVISETYEDNIIQRLFWESELHCRLLQSDLQRVSTNQDRDKKGIGFSNRLCNLAC